MRVAFIEPKPPFNAYYFLRRFPLLGALTMGTVLTRAGHEVRVFKENLVTVYRDRDDRFHPFIESAHVVAITAVTHTVKRAYRIADALRRHFPGKRVLMGGPHVSACPEEALRHADQVAIGEGEAIIRGMVEGTIPERIVSGRPVDMNSIPPLDLSLLAGYGSGQRRCRLPVAPMMASRGCPYDCVFCSVTKLFGRRYRVKEPEHIMEEVYQRYREGFTEAFFYDDNFAASPKKTKRFLRMLIDADLDFHWSSQFSVQVAEDPELVELLKQSKCRTLFIGVESVNPAALRDFRKSQSVSQVRSAMRTLTKAGLGVHAMFVLGADSDDPQSIDETIRFSRRCNAETAQFSILFPIPGTELYERVRAENRLLTHDWDHYDGSHAVIRPKRISAVVLQRKLLRAYLRFYRRSVVGFAASQLGVLLWRLANRGYLRFLRRADRRRVAGLHRDAAVISGRTGSNGRAAADGHSTAAGHSPAAGRSTAAGRFPLAGR